MDKLLQNKVAIITGGTRGIGLETARLFAEQGAQVVIFGSRESTVQKALEDLANTKLDTKGYWPNLANYSEVKSTIDEIHELFGRIDILINNAGITSSNPIEDTTPEDFAQILDINVKGSFHTSKAVIPYMKQQKNGVILNTSSMVTKFGQQSGVGYPTSKFAINGITKSLARELGSYGIRVNAVAPGVTNTDMVASLPEDVTENLIKHIPLKRIGQPQDIANAFLFLASDMASYISGEILSVDGSIVS